MKTINVLKTAGLLLILIIMVSCRNGRATTGKQYPQTETSAKTSQANLPPGQAKKIYGDKSAKAYAPGQRKKYATRYPLVIIYTPAIVISRHNDGRYYYKNTAGYTYWKGYDGRYYLDEKHLKGLSYEVNEYDDWKMKGQQDNKAQESKEKKDEEKNEKDPGKKTKDADQKEKHQTGSSANDATPQKGKGKSKGKA